MDSTQLQDGSGKARRMVHTLEPSTRETEAGKQAGLYESGHVERPCIKIKQNKIEERPCLNCHLLKKKKKRCVLKVAIYILTKSLLSLPFLGRFLVCSLRRAVV